MFPENIKQIYEAGDETWEFYTDGAQDNIEAMRTFLNESTITLDQILSNDGTLVVIREKGNENVLILTSRGDGSGFGKCVDVVVYPFDLWTSNQYE